MDTMGERLPANHHAMNRRRTIPIRHCRHEAIEAEGVCPDCGHSAVSILVYQQDRIEFLYDALRILIKAWEQGPHYLTAWHQVERALKNTGLWDEILTAPRPR